MTQEEILNNMSMFFIIVSILQIIFSMFPRLVIEHMIDKNNVKKLKRRKRYILIEKEEGEMEMNIQQFYRLLLLFID